MTSRNPTSTEHDFRFPRRPDSNANNTGVKHENATGSSPSTHSKTNAGDLRASLRDLALDLTASLNPKHDILRTSIFPHMQNGLSGDLSSLLEMQKKDPVGFTLWSFFAKAKLMLPQRERMENLAWRRMAMCFQKQLGHSKPKCDTAIENSMDLTLPNRPTRAVTNTPSGIAQLRKASEHSMTQEDAMNLDDLINPCNIATPSGLENIPSQDGSKPGDDRAAGNLVTFTSAVPIKYRKEPASQLIPNSVPAASYHRSQHEFDYLTKHHRKTSIDNRRVSSFFLFPSYDLSESPYVLPSFLSL